MLLERLVVRQLLDYLNKSGLLPRLQSAYRFGHSSETAELKVLSDILLAIDSGDLSALVLLDLSAAFDTVDRHSDSAAENVLRSVWNGAAAVPDVSSRPVPVRPNRSLSISSNSDRVWCTAGVRSWSHTDLRVLPTVCITGAPEHHHQLC